MNNIDSGFAAILEWQKAATEGLMSTFNATIATIKELADSHGQLMAAHNALVSRIDALEKKIDELSAARR